MNIDLHKLADIFIQAAEIDLDALEALERNMKIVKDDFPILNDYQIKADGNFFNIYLYINSATNQTEYTKTLNSLRQIKPRLENNFGDEFKLQIAGKIKLFVIDPSIGIIRSI